MIAYIKEKYKNNNLLTDMPVPSAFFKLAIPAIAAQLINILYNLVDKMFIGHIPCVGKQALAGGALDQAPKAIFLTIWRKIIILIPLIFILPQFVPNAVMGVYLAEPIADTIAVCTTAPLLESYYRNMTC